MKSSQAAHLARSVLVAGVWLAALACEPANAPDPPRALSAPASPTRIEVGEADIDPTRPNLLLVSIDTLRADHVSAYGYERKTTPTLDALAARGVLFESAFSHSPKTAPSHMSLMTSLYPEAHRVRNLEATRGQVPEGLSEDLPTLAEILDRAGYSNVAWTAGGNVDSILGFDRGFSEYQQILTGDSQQIFDGATASLADLATRDEPFFLFVHTYQVHAPYLAPKSYRREFVDPGYVGTFIGDRRELMAIAGSDYHKLYREFWNRFRRRLPEDLTKLRALYDACIRYTDDQLAELLERLDALGLSEETIVVVLSDHGEQFGEHGDFEHHALWQEILHVPLVMKVPDTVREGWSQARVWHPVGLIDVLPTLLELMRVPVPGHLQGESLVSVVESGAAPERDWLFAQFRDEGHRALRTGKWKLVIRPDEQVLFNLAADPGEERDASSNAPRLARAAAEHVERIEAASRAYWRLVREGAAAPLSEATLERLEALGYVDRP